MSAAINTASDQTVLAIASAYSRLSYEAQTRLAAVFAGDHNFAQAFDTASLIVAETSSQDLALVLTRLLVMADDDAGLPLRAVAARRSPPTLPPGCPRRRRTDQAEG